jgi:hypothetical protein
MANWHQQVASNPHLFSLLQPLLYLLQVPVLLHQVRRLLLQLLLPGSKASLLPLQSLLATPQSLLGALQLLLTLCSKMAAAAQRWQRCIALIPPPIKVCPASHTGMYKNTGTTHTQATAFCLLNLTGQARRSPMPEYG